MKSTAFFHVGFLGAIAFGCGLFFLIPVGVPLVIVPDTPAIGRAPAFAEGDLEASSVPSKPAATTADDLAQRHRTAEPMGRLTHPPRAVPGGLAPTVQLRTAQQWIEGKSLASDSVQQVVIQSDGRLEFVPHASVLESHPSGKAFFAFTMPQMEAKLRLEFERTSQIHRAQHFLVVQQGQTTMRWAERMEHFLRNVESYFASRRIPLAKPKFPLVAVVFPNREAMANAARIQGETVPQNYLAYYSNQSNRVLLYDDPRGEPLKIATVMHETFHQIAFNCGIHYRTSPTPRWLAEGLATCFEAPGMYDYSVNNRIQDRMPRDVLEHFKVYLQQDTFRGDMVSLIAGDELFASDPQRAYCIAWGLAFYLLESQPTEFAAYLNRTNTRAMFTEYSRSERVTDFAPIAAKGSDVFVNRLRLFFANH